jgi:putative PIN family toxin of toxin-antitoxin system
MVVLDTDVLVAALRSRTGASWQILSLVVEGKVTALASVPLFPEYEAVLQRQEHRQVLGFSEADVTGFLDNFAALVQPVKPHFLWRPQLRDPDDEMVLEAAVCGGAEYLVTFNGRDFLQAAGKFTLEVIAPRLFLERFVHGTGK